VALSPLVKLDCDRIPSKSRVPLREDLHASLQSDLQRTYGRGIGIRFAQRLSLIGGMRVKVGRDVHDGSVQCGLVALEKGF